MKPGEDRCIDGPTGVNGGSRDIEKGNLQVLDRC